MHSEDDQHIFECTCTRMLFFFQIKAKIPHVINILLNKDGIMPEATVYIFVHLNQKPGSSKSNKLYWVQAGAKASYTWVRLLPVNSHIIIHCELYSHEMSLFIRIACAYVHFFRIRRYIIHGDFPVRQVWFSPTNS